MLVILVKLCKVIEYKKQLINSLSLMNDYAEKMNLMSNDYPHEFKVKRAMGFKFFIAENKLNFCEAKCFREQDSAYLNFLASFLFFVKFMLLNSRFIILNLCSILSL